jgi:hypothetical protein
LFSQSRAKYQGGTTAADACKAYDKLITAIKG